MNAISLLLVTSFFGVDYSYDTEEENTTTYVVTIEPEIVDQLKDGYIINSTLPADGPPIDQIRIRFLERSNSSESASVSLLPPSEEASQELPNLTPDPSLIPTPDEVVIPTELTFSPAPVTLPALDADDHFTTVTDSLETPQGLNTHDLLPVFDQADNATDAEAIALLQTEPAVVSIETADSAVEAVSEIAEEDNKPSSVETGQHSTMNHNPVEPDLIETHQDDFIALASNNAKPSSQESPVEISTKESTGQTTLFLLLFSGTLNLFLTFTIIRGYRS